MGTSEAVAIDPLSPKDPSFRPSASEGSRRPPGFSSLRGVRWRSNLGILPSSLSSIQEFRRAAADSRRRYAALRRRLLVDPHLFKDRDKSNDLSMDNPLSQNPDSPWVRFFQNAEIEKIVDRDLSRLYPEQGSYFQTSACQAILRRILLLWCVKHPECGYKQGMHELLAPLLYALHVDLQCLSELRKTYEEHFVDDTYGFLERNAILNRASVKKEDCINKESGDGDFQGSTKTDRDLGELDPDAWNVILSSEPYGAEGELGAVLSDRFLEHDAFCMFDSLMDGAHGVVAMAEFFSSDVGSNPSLSPIIEGSAALYYLLSSVDASLHDHLVGLGVEPHYFALRWLRVLFVREFSLENVLLIWDAIFSCSNTNPSSDVDPSFRILSSPRGLFISAMAVSMLLHLRSSLFATENATSCLQKLLNFPENIHVKELIQKAKLLQYVIPDKNSPLPPPYDHPLDGDKQSTVKDTRLSASSHSSKTHLHTTGENYWEEKWRVLNQEEELMKQTKYNLVSSITQKFHRGRLSLSGLEFSTPFRDEDAGKEPLSYIRRSADDLARETNSSECLEGAVHGDLNSDARSPHSVKANRDCPDSAVRKDGMHDWESAAGVSAKSPSILIPTVKPASLSKEKRTLPARLPWLWKFGKSSSGRNLERGGSLGPKKISFSANTKKHHIGLPIPEGCSDGNNGFEVEDSMLNLKNLGHSIDENIEVIKEFLKQDAGDPNQSRETIGRMGYSTAMAALKELQRIGKLLSDIPPSWRESRGRSPSVRAPNWNKSQDQLLLCAMRAVKASSQYSNGSITSTGWRIIEEKFNEISGMGFSKEQLQHRWKNLKKDYHAYLALRNKSGWSWDDETNQPIAPTEEAWKSLDDARRRLHKNPFMFFAEVHDICSRETATEEHTVSSEQVDHQPMQSLDCYLADNDEFVEGTCGASDVNTLAEDDMDSNSQHQSRRRSVGVFSPMSKRARHNEQVSPSMVLARAVSQRKEDAKSKLPEDPMQALQEAAKELRMLRPGLSAEDRAELWDYMSNPTKCALFHVAKTDSADLDAWVRRGLRVMRD